MPTPYEMIVRWDRQTGVLKGAAVRWADGTVQPLSDGAGGYPLTDLLDQVHADALTEIERLQTTAAAAEQARADAEAKRDSAVAERDQAQQERDQLAAQIAAQAEAAKTAVRSERFWLALLQLNEDVFDQAEALIEQNKMYRVAARQAPTISRDSQTMRAVQQALGVSDEFVDSIFQLAAQIET